MTLDAERMRRDLVTLLAAVDGERAATAVDAAIDACDSFEETGRLVEDLANGFPGIAAVIKQLGDRVRADIDHQHDAESIVIGAAIAMLGLIRYAHADRLRQTVDDS